MKKNGITTGKALIIVMLFSLMATTTLALEGNGDWFTVLARTSGNNVDGSPPTNGDIIPQGRRVAQTFNVSERVECLGKIQIVIGAKSSTGNLEVWISNGNTDGHTPNNTVRLNGSVGFQSNANISANTFTNFTLSSCVSLDKDVTYSLTINDTANAGGVYELGLDNNVYADGQAWNEATASQEDWQVSVGATWDYEVSFYNQSVPSVAPTNNAPVVDITSPANATSHNASFTLNWTVVELENTYLQNITLSNGSGIQLSSLEQVSSVTSHVFNVSGLANGTYTALVVAYETNGSDFFTGSDSGSYITANEGEPTAPPNIAPVVVVNAPSNGTSHDGSLLFNWSVVEDGNTYLQNITLSNGSGVQISSLEQLSSVSTFLFDVTTLANGTYTAFVVAYETNGSDFFTGSGSGTYSITNEGTPATAEEFCPSGQINAEDSIFGGNAGTPILLIIVILLVGVGFSTLGKGNDFKGRGGGF